jgi:hypothetical protein
VSGELTRGPSRRRHVRAIGVRRHSSVAGVGVSLVHVRTAPGICLVSVSAAPKAAIVALEGRGAVLLALAARALAWSTLGAIPTVWGGLAGCQRGLLAHKAGGGRH